MHSELSEALEDHRAGHSPTEVWYEEKIPAFDADGEPILVDGKQASVAIRRLTARSAEGTLRKPCGIPSEIADVAIRALHFSGKHGIDLDRAVEEKMAFNNSRPFKHGKVI